MSPIANFVNVSFKRNAELKAAKDKEIIELIASEELETGTSANKVRTLQRLEILVGAHILLQLIGLLRCLVQLLMFIEIDLLEICVEKLKVRIER